MRILLIHQAFALPDEAGGTRHFEFARHMVTRGHSVRIVASTLSYLTGKRVGEGKRTKEFYEGVEVERAYTYPALHTSFVWRVLSFCSFMCSSVRIALRAPRPDLVIGTSPPIFQAFSAWLISAIRRRPFLLEVRDLWPAFAIDMGVLKNPILITLSSWLERFLYSRADHFLVNSPAYRDYLLERKIMPEKITLIPNGVDCGMFDPDQRAQHIRRKHEVETKFVVTYAGALGSANDIPTILRAAEKLKDLPEVHFLFVGDGKERVQLERLAQDLALRNVVFTGAVPKSEMPDYLAASDVGVATLQNIPMFKTTYPNKVFDYMAAGRPVILAIDGVIREVLETGHAGIFVQPGDSEALAGAVRRLHGNRRLCEEMGRAGRNHVVKYFNRAEQANAFASLVEGFRKDTLAVPDGTS